MKPWRAIVERSTFNVKRDGWFYLLLTPWLAGVVLFWGGPALGALLLSFADWPLPQPPKLVWLAHFSEMLGDGLFWRSLWNTLVYAAGVIPAGLALGLLLAALLNRRGRAAGLWRGVFFLPVVVSGVATALLWGWMFNPRYGLVNGLLGLFGIQGPGWFYDEHWAMPALILMSLWNVGVNMVVYLAALQSIPHELSEAAAMDGASVGRIFWHITRPLLAPATLYLLIANLIGAFQVFTPAYTLTRGGPENATLTLPLYIYLNAFSYGKLGYASALSFALTAIVLSLAVLFFTAARRWQTGDG